MIALLWVEGSFLYISCDIEISLLILNEFKIYCLSYDLDESYEKYLFNNSSRFFIQFFFAQTTKNEIITATLYELMSVFEQCI